MARKGVTFEQVAQAAEQLLADNVLPKNSTVRALLGTGSHTTIAAHLRNWRIARLHDGVGKMPQAVHPTEPKLAQMQARWHEETKRLTHQHEQHLAEKTAKNAALEQRHVELTAENKLLNSQVDKQFVASLKLSNENKKLNRENAVLLERIAQFEEEKQNYQTQMREWGRRLERQITRQKEQYQQTLVKLDQHYKARLAQAMDLQEEYRTRHIVDVDGLQTENAKLREQILQLERDSVILRATHQMKVKD